MKKRKAKQKSILINFILAIIIIFAILYITVFVTGIFDIRYITIDGTNRYEDSEIINKLEIKKGDNSILLYIDNFTNKLFNKNKFEEKDIAADFPYIKEIVYNYISTDNIYLEVIERAPVLQIEYMGEYILLDNLSYVIETGLKEKNVSYPVLKNISLNSIKLGYKIKDESLKEINEILDLLKIIMKTDVKNDKKMYNEISYFDIKGDYIYIFFINDIIAKLGKLEEDSYMINLLREIYYSISKNEKGMIDITNKNSAVFKPEK